VTLISGFLANHGGLASVAIIAALLLLAGVAGIAVGRRAGGFILVALGAYMIAGVSPASWAAPSDASCVLAPPQLPETIQASPWVSQCSLNSAPTPHSAGHRATTSELADVAGTVTLQYEQVATQATANPLERRAVMNEEEE